jgi:hypothetical protein
VRKPPADLDVAATYLAVTILPSELRSAYVRDISVKYSGGPLTYILQALSYGLTSVCLGLLSNYLYDLAKKKLRKKPTSVHSSLQQYEAHIEELREYVSELRNSRKGTKELGRVLAFHEQTLLEIRERDPAIQQYVAEAIEQLESKGAERLAKRVDAHFRIPELTSHSTRRRAKTRAAG